MSPDPTRPRLTSFLPVLHSRRHVEAVRAATHPPAWRAAEQPEEFRPRSAAAPADRGDGAERFGQELARLRHAVRRGPAALRGNFFTLRDRKSTRLNSSHGYIS